MYSGTFGCAQISEMRKAIKAYNSMTEIANSLGFYLTNDYSLNYSNYILVPKYFKKYLSNMADDYKKYTDEPITFNYPWILLSNHNDILVALNSLALTKSKTVMYNTEKEKYVLKDFPKIRRLFKP